MLLSTCACLLAGSACAERLQFAVTAPAQLEKQLRISHELQIEHIGSALDDGEFVADDSGGWLSSTERVDLVDRYLACDATAPRKLVREFRDLELQSKATLTRGGVQMKSDKSKSTSQLVGKGVEFSWIDAEHDYARCFERVEGDEEVLPKLRGELELLALLPGRDVAEGDTWEVDLRRMREILAPGGDLSMFPTTGSIYGRLTEIGVGGDFADFLAGECSGSVTATFRGTREVALPPDEDGTPGGSLRVGVVALAIGIASTTDRAALYRMAMPDIERREPTRLDSVPVDYTLDGQGELLWDLAGGHFHALSITGKETFQAQINKTQFIGSREQHKLAQRSRYSGQLDFQLTAGPPQEPAASDTDASAKKSGKKPKRHKK